MTSAIDSASTNSRHSDERSLAFIGGGNMARSLIGGLLAQGAAASSIRVAEPVAALRDALAADFGVACFEHAAQAADGAATWLLAVKPQVMRAVCAELVGNAQAARPLVISIAAGITGAQLDRWLGGGQAVIRAMPNTPALIGQGVTGLFANPAVSDAQRADAERLLRSAGPTTWIDEEALMDAVTAVSGSGPAYVFLLAEAMQSAAERQGLPPATATLLVQQTIAGASAMLTRSDEGAAVLRSRVTSPGGTTQAAIESFQSAGFERIVDAAVEAAAQRGRELSNANE